MLERDRGREGRETGYGEERLRAPAWMLLNQLTLSLAQLAGAPVVVSAR